jgi:hypothetical protein
LEGETTTNSGTRCRGAVHPDRLWSADRDPCLRRSHRHSSRRARAEHVRHHGRGETIYDPWHCVPVGAPFKDWVLSAALERVRRKLAGSDDGDRQMVAILVTVLIDGLSAVEAACAQAMSEGVHSSDVIINILARQRDPGPIMSPVSWNHRLSMPPSSKVCGTTC